MGIIYGPQSRYKENKDKMLILGWQWLGESHFRKKQNDGMIENLVEPSFQSR